MYNVDDPFLVTSSILKYFTGLDWDQHIKSSENIDHFRRHFKLMRLCRDVKEPCMNNFNSSVAKTVGL